MKIVDCEQGSEQWKALRAGSLGASSVADMMAKTKTGWGASRANLAARLICERLTGLPQETYTNAAMAWGNEKEPDARNLYSFIYDVPVSQVGLVLHPTIKGSHASPDGVIGDDGLIEIKAPNSATHISALDGAPIDDKYIKQMQWQLSCTGRKWVDFCSYDPRFPTEMQLHVRRVYRDDTLITELEKQAVEFISEIDKTVTRLRALYSKGATDVAA